MNNSTSIVSVNTDINNSKNYGKTEVSEKLVTTKELAEILGVDVSTVKKTVKRLEEGGDVLHHLTTDKYNNTVFIFTEKQATLIKQEIQKHHNLSSRQIDTVSTEVEMKKKAAEVIQWYMDSYEAEKNARVLAESKTKELEIKLDESKEWFSIKRMQKLNPGRVFKFGMLKAESLRLGYEIHKTFDQNYGEVNTYHKNVWISLFFDSLNYDDEFSSSAIEDAADKWMSENL